MRAFQPALLKAQLNKFRAIFEQLASQLSSLQDRFAVFYLSGNMDRKLALRTFSAGGESRNLIL
jgi:UDP-2,3-diacylglucosamine pyrophosphatase LpxH